MSIKMSPVERDLNEAIDDLASAQDTNGHWFAGLARLVEATGKPVDDLTIGELRRLIEQRREAFNRIYNQEVTP